MEEEKVKTERAWELNEDYSTVHYCKWSFQEVATVILQVVQ